MFWNSGIAVIFFTATKMFENTKKTRLRNEEIKKQQVNSIIINEIIETEELNEKAEKVEKPGDAAAIIKQDEDIIRTKKEKNYIHSESSRKSV